MAADTASSTAEATPDKVVAKADPPFWKISTLWSQSVSLFAILYWTPQVLIVLEILIFLPDSYFNQLGAARQVDFEWPSFTLTSTLIVLLYQVILVSEAYSRVQGTLPF